MSKWSEDPAFRLNKYIEDSLRLELIIPPMSEYITDTDTDSDYELSFMMSAQQPEILTQYNATSNLFSSLPFCVYTMKDNSTYDVYERSGLVTYTFYYDSTDKLVEIKNFLVDLLDRKDWSAQDINYFYKNDNTYPFDFKSINLELSAGPQPPDEQDGRSSYLISIYWCATYEGPGRAEDYGAQVGLGRI